MDQESNIKAAPTSGGLLASGSVVSAFAALIGASCCVLPIILFKLGIGSALIGGLIFFADKTDYFLIGALLFIVAGVAASFLGGKKPSKRAVYLFAVSFVIVVLAYILPSFEGDILRWTGIR